MVTLPLEANSAVVVLWEPKAARALRVKVAIPTDKRKTREFYQRYFFRNRMTKFQKAAAFM